MHSCTTSLNNRNICCRLRKALARNTSARMRPLYHTDPLTELTDVEYDSHFFYSGNVFPNLSFFRPPHHPIQFLRNSRWPVDFYLCSFSVKHFSQTWTFFCTSTRLMPTVVTEFGIKLSPSTLPIAKARVVYVLLLTPGGSVVATFSLCGTVTIGLEMLAILFLAYSSFAVSLIVLRRCSCSCETSPLKSHPTHWHYTWQASGSSLLRNGSHVDCNSGRCREACIIDASRRHNNVLKIPRGQSMLAPDVDFVRALTSLCRIYVYMQ